MSVSSRTPARTRRSLAHDPVMVYGVIAGSGLEDGATLAGAEVLLVRQLGALIEPVALGNSPDMPQQVAHYRGVIERVFAARAIVPVPYGTSFRSRESVARWLELHYSPLQDALDFVADRATMRVRVGVGATPATEAAAASLDTHLWTVLRALKSDAIAAVPVVPHADGATAADHSAACAYLIETDAIGGFERRVASLTNAEPHLRIDMQGPLPAYDFIKMDFGG